MSNSFVVANPDRCIGCRTCEAACAIAHLGNNMFTAKASEIQFQPRLSVIKTARVTSPTQCRQCEDAPCARGCPVNAITNKDGYIYVEQRKCVGCKTCLMTCPFGAMELITQYNDGERVVQDRFKYSEEEKLYEGKERIVAAKCDLCASTESGPACIEVCPTAALRVINYDDIKKV